jgi:hypothetical protein
MASNNAGKYPDDVEWTCFLLWWETCDRNASKVAERIAEDEEYRAMAGLEPGDRTPDHETIRRWAREKFWDLRATDKMREAAPWRIQAAGTRIAYQSQRAAEVVNEIMEKPNPTPGDKIRLQAALEQLKMTVGNSVVEYARPALSKSVDLTKLETVEDVEAAERAMLQDRT